MGLKDHLQEDMRKAAKGRDSLALSALRMALAAVKNREIDAVTRKEIPPGGALPDEAILKVIVTMVKQRREAAEQFKAGGRLDLVEKELADVPVLEAYLPAQVERAAVEAAIDKAIVEVNASSVKDVGRVMKAVMAQLADQTVDGRAVNEMVRRKLS